MRILIDTIPKVREFCKIANGFRHNVDVVSNRYKIDGKSIMGLFSLNLSDPIEVTVDETEDDIAHVLFAKFEVDE